MRPCARNVEHLEWAIEEIDNQRPRDRQAVPGYLAQCGYVARFRLQDSRAEDLRRQQA